MNWHSNTPGITGIRGIASGALRDLFGIALDRPYEERIFALMSPGIALRDVACSCRRDGSSDSMIAEPECDDLVTFLADRPTIRHVALNGTKAEQLLRKELPVCGMKKS